MYKLVVVPSFEVIVDVHMNMYPLMHALMISLAILLESEKNSDPFKAVNYFESRCVLMYKATQVHIHK